MTSVRHICKDHKPMEGSFTTQNNCILHQHHSLSREGSLPVAANVTPSSKMRIRNMSLMYHEHGFWKKVFFVFFKEKLEEAREMEQTCQFQGWLRSVHVTSVFFPFHLTFADIHSRSGSEFAFPRKASCDVSVQTANILTGSEVEDEHNRRMNVQVYSPKEEQALPPNYEQLLNRTEHQQRQKMYVCGWKKYFDVFYKSMHLPPKRFS